MGRQFSYFCCPEDLAEIERTVFQPLGGSLIATEKRDSSHTIRPMSSFALSRDQMGAETLLLYLLPPEELRSIVFSGPWLDASRSHLIEVGRSYIHDGTIGVARFWYEARFLQDAAFVEKPKEFVDWSQLVFKRTKAMLERHSYPDGKHVYSEWFGKSAWKEVQGGVLKLA